MNANKLRSVMVLHGHRGSDMAKMLDLSHQRFSAKLNSKNGAEFTQSEIQTIKDIYGLSAEEVDSIFFNQKVS